MKDNRGYIFSKIRRYRIKIYSTYSSFYAKFIALFKGIELGKSVKFYGISVMVRAYKSKITIGDKCSFRSDFTSNLIGINRKCIITTLKKDAKILIGENSGFSGTVIAASRSIRIGKNVLCGANTTITDFDWHGIDPEKRRIQPEGEEVVIGDNVWLGLNSVVLKGVSIGENSVIGANSVVTKDIPANVIAAGNPCKVIKGF